MIASIDLFEALKSKFGEQEARVIVKEIEKIEEGVDKRVDKKFEEAKQHLSTKEDLANTKAEIIKWMFVFWAGTVISMIGVLFAFIKMFVEK